MKKIPKTLLTVLITFIATVLLIFIALCLFLSMYDMPFSRLIKVGKIIESSYVEEYDAQKCEEDAINAVLEGLGDKYAVYYDEENAKQTMQMIEGYYVGIGIEIFANMEKDRIEVISAYEDAPADRAGIRSGDLIISIDSVEYTATTMADAVIYMRGLGIGKPLEKPINMTIQRGEEMLNLNMYREQIDVYKVTSEMVDDICYIRYTGFTQNSEKELEKIIASLDEKKVKGIVIDIRNNPGGEFGSAINMCDLFLEKEMIMYTEDKNGKRTEYFAHDGACKLPLAVIVNGASASASEIFAGSMQANKRAVIVGEETYGKGVSQTVRYINPFDLSEGAIKLTTCKNYTSDGKWINEKIIPDIEVKTEKTEGEIRLDAAFNAARDSLKKGK